MNHQRAWCRADSAYRGEILSRIIPRGRIHARGDRQRTGESQHERVAIGSTVCNLTSTHSAGSAGALVDDKLLAHRLREPIGEKARNDACTASGWKRVHNGD